MANRTKSGITPAPAGKTEEAVKIHPGGEDHPRTCGENTAVLHVIVKIAGSPPHLRGKPSSAHIAFAVSRITPAPAGKTRIMTKRRMGMKDHPRTCGENFISLCNPSRFVGSPPHLRGKLAPLSKISINPRITPAPAGKTGMSNAQSKLSRDHPRTCGENFTLSSPKLSIIGSPPHLRGKLYGNSKIGTYPRITPAPAGKTSSCIAAHACTRDHPRTCGENKGASPLHMLSKGSPPHLRGKRYLLQDKQQFRRITPAPAGKTTKHECTKKPTEDHPRTCGENRV